MPPKIGVLVMAHGGDTAWNKTVLEAVGPLRQQLPVAVALGMAERSSMQAAVAELEAAGVQRAVVVRLFVSGASFRAQTEYLLDLSDEAPRFFMGHEGPEPPARLARTLDVTISDAGLVDSPLVGQILSERVAALSIEPERETILILAHGMGLESDNDALLHAMGSRAEVVRNSAPYHHVVVETLREDWQDPRKEAEARIRALLQDVANAGGRMIVVPLRVSGFGNYAEVLEGLEYEADGRGLLPHPLVSEWIRRSAAQAVCMAGWEVESALGLRCSTPEGESATEPVTQFEVLRTLEIGQAPHGIRFSADGSTAYVALSGDDEIAVVDLETMQVTERWPAGATPLDLVALDSGGWAVTQFRGDTLVSLDTAGESRTWSVGKAPSLFGARIVDGIAPLVSEFADELTLFDVRTGEITARYPTGDRPYPAEITADGVLAFVPNRDAGTVSVIDLLAGTTLAEVDVCPRPEGGGLTADDVSYIVACGGSDELVYVNTASFEVTARVAGVGPRPFSVAITPDGRYGLANNASGTTVSVLDVEARAIIDELTVGEQPIAIRMHPDGRHAYVSSEVSGTFTEIALPGMVEPARGTAPTQVAVFGMIHGAHRTSERFGVDTLREAIRAFAPDFVLVEIPPNRFDAAAAEFAANQQIVEPRVLRFPEYVDVLFPLTLEMDFEIIPTAGWTRPMSDHRNALLRAIGEDPTRTDDWAEYEAANAASEAAVNAGGDSDDPQWIHTDEYDDAQEIALSVYDRLFNDEIGPGGWANINRAHYANIARALDRIAGSGQRVLITYGAGHKGWFLRQLRGRDDIELVDARQFFR